MTNTKFAIEDTLFGSSVITSLTAIICLACLHTYGVPSGLQMATASVTFIFCALRKSNQEQAGGWA